MNINIEGDVTGDLLIQEGIVFLGGDINGQIEAAKIAVQEKCRFDGRLIAEILVSMGYVNGECHCKKIQLKDKSVTAATLVSNDVKIETGATITGTIKNLEELKDLETVK